MKTIIYALISGLLVVPTLSWIIYGSMGQILPWFGLIGALALVVIVVMKIQGRKPF